MTDILKNKQAKISLPRILRSSLVIVILFAGAVAAGLLYDHFTKPKEACAACVQAGGSYKVVGNRGCYSGDILLDKRTDSNTCGVKIGGRCPGHPCTTGDHGWTGSWDPVETCIYKVAGRPGRGLSCPGAGRHLCSAVKVSLCQKQ